MQKQTGFYKTHLKKHVKTVAQKLRFNLNFLVGHAVQNTIWFVTKHLIAFVFPQRQKLVKNKCNLSFPTCPRLGKKNLILKRNVHVKKKFNHETRILFFYLGSS
jgi:hypothetical protein